ncbi:MAG TPA: NrsF family protein [Polyangia bacterium]|nr:NrsF family protein [Polyangia bacterium]
MEPRELAGKAPPPSPDLLRATAGGGAVRTRRPGRALAIVIALSLLYAIGLMTAVFRGARKDLAAQPLAFMIGIGLAWALGFVAPLALALVPPRRQVLPRVAAARLAAALASFGLVALSLLLARAVPGESLVAADGAQLAHATLRCFGVAMVVAVVPLAAGMIALKRALPVGARAIGAALGAAGGALGGLVLHLHCAWAEPLHVALGHGGAVVAGALAGALLAPLVIDQ